MVGVGRESRPENTAGGEPLCFRGTARPPSLLAWDVSPDCREFDDSRVRLSRPEGFAMGSERPDSRRVVCSSCRAVFFVCSWCDRGNRYCGVVCSTASRRQSVRCAGRRYQRSPEGRRRHRHRQNRYRLRQAVARNVTHQGTREEVVSERVSGCDTETPSSSVCAASAPPPPSIPRRHVCVICGSPCRPFVRVDFLRRRRRGGGRDRRDLGPPGR